MLLPNMISFYYSLGFLLICVPWRADGIMWYLEPNTQKCLKEELQQNDLVTGEYEVSPAPGQKVHYIVSFTILYYFYYECHYDSVFFIFP